MTTSILGERHLPCCDKQPIVLTSRSAGKRRRCELCGTVYRIVEQPVSDHVKKSVGNSVRKLVLEVVA